MSTKEQNKQFQVLDKAAWKYYGEKCIKRTMYLFGGIAFIFFGLAWHADATFHFEQAVTYLWADLFFVTCALFLYLIDADFYYSETIASLHEAKELVVYLFALILAAGVGFYYGYQISLYDEGIEKVLWFEETTSVFPDKDIELELTFSIPDIKPASYDAYRNTFGNESIPVENITFIRPNIETLVWLVASNTTKQLIDPSFYNVEVVDTMESSAYLVGGFNRACTHINATQFCQYIRLYRMNISKDLFTEETCFLRESATSASRCQWQIAWEFLSSMVFDDINMVYQKALKCNQAVYISISDISDPSFDMNYIPCNGQFSILEYAANYKTRVDKYNKKIQYWEMSTTSVSNQDPECSTYNVSCVHVGALPVMYRMGLTIEGNRFGAIRTSSSTENLSYTFDQVLTALLAFFGATVNAFSFFFPDTLPKRYSKFTAGTPKIFADEIEDGLRQRKQKHAVVVYDRSKKRGPHIEEDSENALKSTEKSAAE